MGVMRTKITSVSKVKFTGNRGESHIGFYVLAGEASTFIPCSENYDMHYNSKVLDMGLHLTDEASAAALKFKGAPLEELILAEIEFEEDIKRLIERLPEEDLSNE